MRKISRGKGFGGALNYAFYGKKGKPRDPPGIVIGGNMTGQTARKLSAEFAQAHQLRPDIQKPVWHQVLSLPHGEKLTDERWATIADDYMKRMEFTDKNQWVAVLHNDKEHQHVHLIASRIGLDGKVWYGRNDNLISSRVTQELEKDYGLTITRGPDEPSLLKTRMNGPERAMWERKGQQPPKERIAEAIEQALAKARNLEAFKAAVASQGVQVKVNQSPTTGKISGLSFELDGNAYKASQIHRKYSWANLSKQFTERTTNEPHAGNHRPIPPAHRRQHLRHLSECTLAGHRHFGEVLLPADVRNRLGDSQAGIHPDLRWGNSIALVAPDPIKQAYKARLLEQHYQTEVRDALRMVIQGVQMPTIAGDPLSIRLRGGGGQVTDHGDRLTCGRGQAAEIAAMVELARVKGWQRVTLTGSPEFQKRAAQAYAAAGIRVMGADGKALPVTDKEALREKARQTFGQNDALIKAAQQRPDEQQHDERSNKWKSRSQH